MKQTLKLALLIGFFHLNYSIAGITSISQPIGEDQNNTANETETKNTYSATFHETDIKEFVATAAKILQKNIIIDPSITGTVSVRSFDQLDKEQYLSFFLNVMEVYGYSVIRLDNHTLNIVPQAQSLRAALTEANKGKEKNIVVRLARMNNLSGGELEPILNKMADDSAVRLRYYAPGNLFVLTGREDVVDRLAKTVRDVDNARGENRPAIFMVSQAKASDIARSLQGTFKNVNPEDKDAPLISGNDATRTIVVKGGLAVRRQIAELIKQMDVPNQQSRVFFLKYADAVQTARLLSGSQQGSSEPSVPRVPSGFGGTGSSEAMLNQQVQNSLDPSQSGDMSGQGGGSDLTNGEDSQSDSSSLMEGDALIKQIRVHADRSNNALVVSAPPAAMQQVASIVDQLDVRHQQVLVEAIVVEVQKAEGLNLGISWGNKNYGGSNYSAINVANGFGQADPVANALKGTEGLVAGFYHGNWGTLFNALESNRNNNILATPSVVTLDNNRAEFNVGQDVPILTGSQTTNSDNIFNTVQRRTIGMKFSILPRINQSGTVLLKIAQEISSLSDNNQTNSNLGAIFNIRTVNNVVQVQDGETVVIGGLLDDERKETVNKVPILGDIPLIGNLFRYRSHSVDKRNLMLFIRPQIITDSRFDRVNESVGQVPHLPGANQRYRPSSDQAEQATQTPRGGTDQILNDIQQFTREIAR